MMLHTVSNHQSICVCGCLETLETSYGYFFPETSDLMRKKAKEVFPKCANMTASEREKEFREIRAGYDEALSAAGESYITYTC